MQALTKKEQPYLRSFGRTKGKKLRDNQQELLDRYLPKFAVELGGEHRFSCNAALKNYRHIALEIGFGAGEHLMALASARPESLCIGAEPFVNGVVKLLSRVVAENISNVRIYSYDVRELLDAMPAEFLDDSYILFPDPWPKARHHKRRLVTQAFLKSLARAQKPGGILQFATDHREYAAWILNQLHETPYYSWQVDSKHDWQTPPVIWDETKYQRKTSEQGRSPMFFKCVRTQQAA